MGVLPLTFPAGVTRQTLKLDGTETIDITGIETITPRMDVKGDRASRGRHHRGVHALCRVDTADEVEYYRHGGILQYVLRGMAVAA